MSPPDFGRGFLSWEDGSLIASNSPVRCPIELSERAVRIVREGTREGVYCSEWTAIQAVAQMLGPTPQTVRVWVRIAAAQCPQQRWATNVGSSSWNETRLEKIGGVLWIKRQTMSRG